MPKKKARLTLSEQFREYVRDCGLKSAEISRRTGISPSMLSQFLSGTKFLGTDNMDAIAELLGLTLIRKEPTRRGKP